ncbi:hypothetical protein FRC07_013423 [Ceratobasidium sp. 392]|nr:hypothetical protein FRC07_013423 [Ceratobasidium sp. 392]
MPFKHLKRRAIVPLPRPSQHDFQLMMELPTESRPPILSDVQGDTVYIFPKAYEKFTFFRINDAKAFKSSLKNFDPMSSEDVRDFLDEIDKEKDAAEKENRPPARLKPKKAPQQIAFTRLGLNTLGVTGKTGDARFDQRRMRDDKTLLGDLSNWDSIFDTTGYDETKGTANDDLKNALHGVIMVVGSSLEEVNETSQKAGDVFGTSAITIMGTIEGKVREGEGKKGHEHFGYKDGVSQPEIRGIAEERHGHLQVDPGVILMGYPGDPMLDSRPSWTKDGTILVFRKLEQDVIGFENYVKERGQNWKNFIPKGNPGPDLSEQEGIDLFGARLLGRWKSGAPLARCPYRDNQDIFADEDEKKKISDDPKRINDFNYVVDTVPGSVEYGNNNYFPTTSFIPTHHGQDPIIGYSPPKPIDGGLDATASFNDGDQVEIQFPSADKIISVSGFAKVKPPNFKPPPPEYYFVTSRGGEYFFVPSIQTVEDWANSEHAE